MLALFRRLLRLGPARTAKQKSGDLGERVAADFLRQRGYKIIARNWRSPHDRRDELDLVARDGEVLVFIEVKTRAAGALVSGYHAVDARKKKVLRRAADAYLRALPAAARPRTMRFDIIEVAQADQAAPEVHHFESVPLFGKHYGEL